MQPFLTWLVLCNKKQEETKMLNIIQLVTEILIPVAFFASMVYTIKVISDNRVKRKMLEKGVKPGELNFLLVKKFNHQTNSDHKFNRSRVFLGT